IGTGDVFHQLINGDVFVVDQGQATAHHFGQVVGRNIGGHTHGDTRGTVDQQVGNTGGQDGGNALGAVVVVDIVDGFLVQVSQQVVSHPGHADFGVTHGGGAVAVDGAKVALTVHQHIAQRKGLRHTHYGVVHRRVAVRVVFTDNVTHHAGGFQVG